MKIVSIGLDRRTSVLVIMAFVSFGTYVLSYIGIVLTIAKAPILPTVNRITIVDAQFTWTLTGLHLLDLMIISMLLSLTLLVFFRSKFSIPLSIFSIFFPAIGFIHPMFQSIVDTLFILIFPIAVILFLFRKALRFDSAIRYRDFVQGLIVSVLLAFLTLEVVAASRWMIHPFVPVSPANWSWGFNNLENGFYYTSALLTSALFILSVTSFIYRPYISLFFNIRKRFMDNDTPPSSSNFSLQITIGNYFLKPVITIAKKKGFLLLAIAVLPSLLICLYPYSLLTNKNAVLGTDIDAYLQWMNNLEHSGSSTQFITTLFTINDGARPLSLFLIYFGSLLTGMPELVVLKYLPLVLGPSLVISVYLLTDVVFSNKKIAIISAIITAISHQLIVGFYASFYSNMLALIAIYFALIFMFKYIRNPTWKYLLLYVGFSLTSLLLHSFTWSYFMAVIVLFLTWTFLRRRRNHEDVGIILILALATTSVIIVDACKSYYVGSTGGFQKDFSLASEQTGIEEFARRWSNLKYSFTVYLGGFLNSPYMAVLLLAWTLRARYDNDSDRLLLSALIVSLIPIVLGDYVIQSRIFYNIPIQIPAAIVMFRLFSSPRASIGKLVFIGILFAQYSYSLRAMSNMELVLPGLEK